MSFLESIQHGLEKASQEATRLAKIQHLQSVANDLNFKTAQQGQYLIAQAMNMYHRGILAQGELTAICQQIALYEQQINEVGAEIQKLKKNEDAQEDQQVTAVPPPPTGYPAVPAQPYPTGTVPPPYPAYPNTGAYPVQTGYPGYPASPGNEQPTQQLSTSNEPPTSPGAPAQVNEAPAQATPHKSSTHHRAAATTAETSAPAPAAGQSSAQSDTAGTYPGGTLPPIYSPFAANPAPTDTTPPEAKPAAEPRRTKKTTDNPSAQDKQA